MSVIEKLIEKGELAREQGKFAVAQAYFDQVIFLAGQKRQWKYAIDAMGHQLIILKHLYNQNRDKNFLELMLSVIVVGLKISRREKLPLSVQAPLILRWGDYYLLQKKYKESLRYYAKAMRVVGIKEKGVYAEYMGFYGHALVMSGKKIGFKYLEKAVRMIKGDKTLRPFHRLSVLCGLHLRTAEAAQTVQDDDLVQDSLNAAKEAATWLDKKYKQPMRLTMYRKVVKELRA